MAETNIFHCFVFFLQTCAITWSHNIPHHGLSSTVLENHRQTEQVHLNAEPCMWWPFMLQDFFITKCDLVNVTFTITYSIQHRHNKFNSFISNCLLNSICTVVSYKLCRSMNAVALRESDARGLPLNFWTSTYPVTLTFWRLNRN